MVEIAVRILTHVCLFQTLSFLALLPQFANCFFHLFSLNPHNNNKMGALLSLIYR